MSDEKLTVEKFQREIEIDSSIKHVNDLLQRHIDECNQGSCNDLAPVFTGKIFKWSVENTKCEIYDWYTTKDSPEHSTCPIGSKLNKIVRELQPSTTKHKSKRVKKKK